MTADRQDLDALIAEVATLKRRVHVYGRALAASAAMGIGAAVLFAASPLQSQQHKITATEITLVDSNGVARGVWSGETGIALNNSALAMYGADNARRLLMNVADDEPTIYFLDKEGSARMYMDINAKGEPRLGMNDDAIKLRALLTVGAGKVPVFALHDETAQRRVQMNVEPESGSLVFLDANGAVTTRLQPR